MGKYYIKKNIIGFIVGVILCTGTFVYAAVNFPSNEVTYDNTESGLSSTNVKGAIDELYETCTALPPGEQIIEDNNLEKDGYECRYFFTGGNPNNYVTFNNEQAGWRIISVECDGRIKIMKNESIGEMIWNTSGYGSDWARPASLNTYLNSTYLSNLSSETQAQVVTHDFGIGGVKNGNNNLEEQINDENNTIWNGKVALPVVSEVLRTNSNISCKTFLSYNINSICRNSNWMLLNGVDWWTLSFNADNSRNVFNIDNGNMIANYGYSSESAIRPTLYLSSEVKITGGDGSQSNPYTLSL